MDFPLYALFEVPINSTFANLCVICHHGNIVFSVNHAFWIFGQILSKQHIKLNNVQVWIIFSWQLQNTKGMLKRTTIPGDSDIQDVLDGTCFPTCGVVEFLNPSQLDK
jgi:hypothetical protein